LHAALEPGEGCVLILTDHESHVFCLDCANAQGLTGHRPDDARACPACRTKLTNPDDAVITNLHPTEDYKTSVLSGLSPDIVMECAGRALGFWTYQTAQETFVYRRCRHIDCFFGMS